ncbi:MAG: hypothetical protein QW035_04185 [Candidatus Anstonellales archaeon]
MRGSMRYFTKVVTLAIAMLSLSVFCLIVSDFLYHRDIMLDYYFMKAEAMMVFKSLYSCGRAYDSITLYHDAKRCKPLEIIDFGFLSTEGAQYIPALIYDDSYMAPRGGFIGISYKSTSAKKLSSLIMLACQGQDYKGFIQIDEPIKISGDICSPSECFSLPCTARTTTLSPGYHWIRIYNSYGIVEVIG